MFEELFEKVRFEVWVALGVLIAAFVLNRTIGRKKYKLPPGPTGLPIFGYLPFLSKHPYLKFIDIAKTYGDVFSIYLGSKLVVLLNDVDSVREALAKRELLARPPNSPFDIFGMKTPFFTPDFNMWQEQRRFVVHSMKDLGLGKSKIEGHIQEEILHFLSVLKATNGKPINLVKPLTPSMSNNICALVFGERYQYDDPARVMMDTALEDVGKVLGQTQVHLFLPWIRKIPMFTKQKDYNNALQIFGRIRRFIDERILRHKETLDPKNTRDFIDSYLLEMQRKEETNTETTLSVETLLGCVGNLFGAGSETVRTTITWCMYTMATYPDIQEKVQQEIQEVLGSSRFPEFPDHKKMPYTQAVIREIMRWKTVVPLNGVRYALDDIDIAGYDVPKGSIVIANFWAVHHDPRLWKDPDDFLPERFLDKSGNLLKNSNFMPFSAGKRSCPGETMANMEVFLYFVSILQKFRVAFPPGFKPNFDAELGITLRLKPHKICFLPK